MEQVTDARMSLDNDDIRKVMILKASIASSVITNEVEKLEGKDVFKYSLKQRGLRLPTKISVKLNRYAKAAFVSELFQRLVVLANGC